MFFDLHAVFFKWWMTLHNQPAVCPVCLSLRLSEPHCRRSITELGELPARSPTPKPPSHGQSSFSYLLPLLPHPGHTQNTACYCFNSRVLSFPPSSETCLSALTPTVCLLLLLPSTLSHQTLVPTGLWVLEHRASLFSPPALRAWCLSGAHLVLIQRC